MNDPSDYWRARDEFRRHVPGQNFMTPELMYFREAGRFVVELSTGMFLGDRLFGVTVVETGVGRDYDLSQAFHSREDAERFIDELAAR